MLQKIATMIRKTISLARSQPKVSLLGVLLVALVAGYAFPTHAQDFCPALGTSFWQDCDDGLTVTETWCTFADGPAVQYCFDEDGQWCPDMNRFARTAVYGPWCCPTQPCE